MTADEAVVAEIMETRKEMCGRGHCDHFDVVGPHDDDVMCSLKRDWVSRHNAWVTGIPSDCPEPFVKAR